MILAHCSFVKLKPLKPPSLPPISEGALMVSDTAWGFCPPVSGTDAKAGAGKVANGVPCTRKKSVFLPGSALANMGVNAWLVRIRAADGCPEHG
mmetsp:Transcript_6559/g.8095  ORF Transcript_6559/g.8095 Transcript_6559/m.8095 type:complete len:94 (-) Transcript_6559:105-386(-)